jgi:hypothetical protein
VVSAGAWLLQLGPERSVTANYAIGGVVTVVLGLVVAAFGVLRGRTA